MNKSKVIGILTAVLGVIVSFSAAIALYTKGVANVGFDIGSSTYTSNSAHADYKINGSSNPTVQPSYLKKDGTNGGTKLDGEYRHVKYEFTLGATFDEENTLPQYFVVGDLGVTLTNINEALLNKAKVSMYFEGYVDGSLGKEHYGANMYSGETEIKDLILTESSLSVNTKEMAVAAAGIQKLVVYFDLDALDTLLANELTNMWTLSVSWGESLTFGAAHIINDKVLWYDDDEFVMAPNINKTTEGWEWTAAIKGSSELTVAKCHNGETYENHDNHELEDGKIYDVYWSGNSWDAASFVARASE